MLAANEDEAKPILQISIANHRLRMGVDDILPDETQREQETSQQLY